MRSSVKTLSVFLFFCASICFHSLGHAKEVQVTKEWQLLGENDTIPAGMHVRMDMTTGEKWVKEIDDDENDDTEDSLSTEAALIQPDGSVQKVEKNEINEKAQTEYDYDMMHRTLSKLPDEEKERIGGIPELPQSTGSRKITSEERKAFEKKMADIWEKRQEELKELQESIMDLPTVLKERIKSIKAYLQDPTAHLNNMNLDEEPPEGMTTHIVSVLQDLEFQLGDVDNSRDFHTLGGWPLLASLLSEEVHVPQNKTISRLSRRTEAKIRAIQAQAAWAIGTSVKNTGEFYPYAVESFRISNSGDRVTAIDLLIEAFCKEYKDPESWGVRTLLGKSLYGIGSLLRGNRLSQAHILKTNGAQRLGARFHDHVSDKFHTSGIKIGQKLLSLASDVISDITLHGEEMAQEMNQNIIQSFSSSDWCDSTLHLLEDDFVLPIPVQQTLLETVGVLAPHCRWEERKGKMRGLIQEIQSGWNERKQEFDPDHFQELTNVAKTTLESLANS